jgi:hypothetical protein
LSEGPFLANGWNIHFFGNIRDSDHAGIEAAQILEMDSDFIDLDVLGQTSLEVEKLGSRRVWSFDLAGKASL